MIATEDLDEHLLILREGIRPNPETVKAMIEYPIPRNPKELHRFVGLASYFRRFIPQFSIIAKPLYDLLRKNAVFQFDTDALNVFETLKSKLISAPVLLTILLQQKQNYIVMRVLMGLEQYSPNGRIQESFIQFSIFVRGQLIPNRVNIALS
ncbi:Retrovirus-related Pol polyprotein from transposon 297-like Protein [Tribolium castaneum]|uniref:RNA-directed DNA polymerase n=1 Tax=Tribolium castaneum TaxID=7070 RepID=A0A139WA70_TRICA|nr:Retrovirus-related Pol polyprotein from transposon 297-like Protein [Tribolium castaneum]